MRVLITVLALLTTSLIHQECRALDLTLQSGLVHLPASSYHYLGYTARLGIGKQESRFVFDLGTSHPYSNPSSGVSQVIGYSSVAWEWTGGKDSFFKPYVGAGLGVFLDRVANQNGLLPALVTHGGIKLGGSRFGVTLGLDQYLGVIHVSQLLSWTAWPLINLMGGLYAGF